MDRRQFLVTVAATGAVAAAQARPSTPSVTPALKPAELLDITRVPGYALVGVLEGKPVAEFAGNRATPASGATPEAIDADTCFPALSLTKVVFVWAVRRLVREGRLDWQKPLQDYLPLGLEGEAAKITAHHVISHSTGLTNWRFEANTALVSNFPPGTRFSYSGEGFFLLQRVVEHIVGESVASYMKKTTLPEVGITTGSLAWTPSFLKNGALGHNRQGETMARSMVFYERSNEEAMRAAGLDPLTAKTTEIVEAYKKANRQTNPVTLSPNVAGSMWMKPVEFGSFLQQVLADATKSPAEYAPVVRMHAQLSWGRGWAVDHIFPGNALWVYGDGPGYKNLALVHPQSKTALAIFTNGERGANLYAGILRQKLGRDAAVFYWI